MKMLIYYATELEYNKIIAEKKRFGLSDIYYYNVFFDFVNRCFIQLKSYNCLSEWYNRQMTEKYAIKSAAVNSL